MWNRNDRTESGFNSCTRGPRRALGVVAMGMAILLGASTIALAQADRDNNPPGPRGGPGTNWENPPGPRGGPGASPDPIRWRPPFWRRIFDNDNNPPGPRGGPGTNWENPPGPRGGPGASPDAKPYRPWTLRRIYNALNPAPQPDPWARRRAVNAQPASPGPNPWARRRAINLPAPTVHRALPRPAPRMRRR